MPPRGILYALDYAFAAVFFLICALMFWVFAPPRFWRRVPGLVRLYGKVAPWRLYAPYVGCACTLIVAAIFGLVATSWALGIGPTATGEPPSAADIGAVTNDLTAWLTATLIMLAFFAFLQARGLRRLRRLTAQRAAEDAGSPAPVTTATSEQPPAAGASGT